MHTSIFIASRYYTFSTDKEILKKSLTICKDMLQLFHRKI